ncbi:MAG: hypothetical protein HUK07_05695, partial [Bacteroidaceae bacterium]|nr:hypothetical protein [Bacteroidaceae bacterium]
MKRRLFYTFLFLIVTLCSFAQSKPVIKVDMSFAGRQDQEVLEPGYVNWATGTNRKDAETTIEGISFKFTTEDDKIFRNDWSKNYIQNADYKAKNGRLTFDCILLDPMTEEGTLLLSIKGLPAGQHTLQTYHNCKDNPASVDVRAMNVFVNGNLVCENLKPTIGEAVAANTTISVVSFNVASEEATTVIRYTTKGIADPITSKATIVRSPIICGFELNTVNIQEQAKDPLPASGDMHTDCDGGSCVLQWQSASDKIVAHNLYLGTDSATVADMTTPTAANLTAPNYLATSLSTHNVYYWRVDEISGSGNVTKGNVWAFRPRRLAFPEAEGYGRFAIGGRGGAVYHVTNLNHDHQPGSLLYGLVDMEGPRTIVFDVSGVIAMDFGSVFVDPNVTIAAHTAPGKGICLKHSNLNIGSDNICRFLRARRGYGDTGNAMGITGSDHAIIDHTSALWGTDETFSSRGAKNITFQYSMIAEALGIADHKNYDSGKNHGFAATIGGETGTFSHNYLVDCQGRNWSLGGGLDGAGYYAGRLDIFNNVVYNWGGRATDGGAHEVNFVGNYYKVGPANGTKTLLNAQLEGVGKGSQSYYVNGNIRQEINNGSLTSDKQGSTYKYSLSGGQVLDWEVW